MLTFIPAARHLNALTPPVPSRPTLTARNHVPTHPLRKRVRMSTGDRFTEFSLTPPDDPDSSSSFSSSASSTPSSASSSSSSSSSSSFPHSTSPPAFDWAAWRAARQPAALPALPFPPAEVFMPGEVKRLHLFEARYLALFESMVVRYDKRCAHVLVDTGRQAMAAFGTLLHVRSWRRLDVGVVVELEGVGRLKTARMKAPAPYLSGEFVYVDDEEMGGAGGDVAELERRLWVAFGEVVTLCLKLGEDPVRKKKDTASETVGAVEGKTAPPSPRESDLAQENPMFSLSVDAKRMLYEQRLKQGAKRAVDEEDLDFGDEIEDGEREKRLRGLSFAAWDFFPSKPGMRQKAIEGKVTLVRLRNAVEGLEVYARQLAAKAAVESAFSD